MSEDGGAESLPSGVQGIRCDPENETDQLKCLWYCLKAKFTESDCKPFQGVNVCMCA